MGGAALAGAAVLSAGLAAPAIAGAAPTYPASATITSAGPTIFSAPVTDQPVANLVVKEVVAGGVPTGYVCVTPSQGSFVASSATETPTVTATGGIAVSTPAISGSSISFQVTTASTAGPGSITIANLHATTGGPGRATVSMTDGLASACATAGGNTLTSTTSAFAVETSTQNTYGTNPSDTTAIEYGAKFACTGTTGTVAHTAVLATSAQPYDALSAATLEGALGAGLLITSPTGLDAATATALRNDGVTTVYVVGGPLAVSPPVMSTLQGTDATQCQNGVPATTGAKIKVVGPIYGQTADATASAIDAQANTIAPFTTSQPAINLSAVTATTYNDTTGNASPTGSAAAAGRTAVLVSDTDFQDSMTASGMAYATHLPIVLTPGASLGTDATTTLKALGTTQVIVLGGQLAIQPAVVTTLQAMGMTVVRIAGQDGTDTAGMLARFEDAQAANAGLGWVPTPAGSALLAQGASANDALGAAAISGMDKASIYLTEGPTKGLGGYSLKVLADAGSATGLGSAATPAPIYALQVLGGPLAVPQGQIAVALLALGGAAS